MTPRPADNVTGPRRTVSINSPGSQFHGRDGTDVGPLELADGLTMHAVRRVFIGGTERLFHTKHVQTA